MRISKKDLMSVISEQEFSEMAYRPKGTQDVSNKISSGRPIWFPGNENDDMPDGWELNPTKTPGEEKYFMFLNGKAEEEWIQQNSEFLDQLYEKTGKDFVIVDKKSTKYKPRRKEFGTSYIHSGVNLGAATKIKRIINKIVFETLATPDVNARLERLSIPDIRARDAKHLNRYGKISNEEINYGTHTFNSYTSAEQFLDFALARVQNKSIPAEYKSYHLARQFNKMYNNWDETVKNNNVYHGKTDSYKLDKYGFDEDNLDVTVRMDLIIKGRLNTFENTYKWVINFKTRFGRKLKDSHWMGSLSPDKNVVIEKEISFDPQEEFNDTNTVMDNFQIATGLIEGLTELKDKFFNEFKPLHTIKLASIKQTDVIPNRDRR